MTSVTDFDVYDNQLQQVSYTYDANNRMVSRTLQVGIGSPTSGYFIYDGNQMTLALDEDGNVEHRLLWGPAVDQILADENAWGDTSWLLTDNQNTVRDVVIYDEFSEETDLVNHIAYDSFGNKLSETNASWEEFPLNYTGRYFDEATGLQWNLNRWYNPEVGRWMSEDPIGFFSGQQNLTTYVANQPNIFTDPLGLQASSLDQYFKDRATYTVWRAGQRERYNNIETLPHSAGTYAHVWSNDDSVELDLECEKIGDRWELRIEKLFVDIKMTLYRTTGTPPEVNGIAQTRISVNHEAIHLNAHAKILEDTGKKLEEFSTFLSRNVTAKNSGPAVRMAISYLEEPVESWLKRRFHFETQRQILHLDHLRDSLITAKGLQSNYGEYLDWFMDRMNESGEGYREAFLANPKFMIMLLKIQKENYVQFGESHRDLDKSFDELVRKGDAKLTAIFELARQRAMMQNEEN